MNRDTLLETWPRRGGVTLPEAVRPAVVVEVRRWFFAACALLCAVAGTLTWLAPERTGGGPVAGTAWLVLAAAAVALRQLPERWLRPALLVLTAAASALIALRAALLGGGAWTVGTSTFGVLVCFLCAVAGWRAGALLAAIDALLLLLVQWAAMRAGATPAGGLLPLVANLMALALGLAVGVMVSRIVGRYLGSATEREQRFRSLLGLAADAYWEIDQDYRLTSALHQRDEARALGAADGLGRQPWELPAFDCEHDVLDGLMADLDARLPFRDVMVRWTPEGSRTHLFLASGAPRFDPRGLFLGYWGVARDVTAEVAAREALAATETRYRELFGRIPTPLVLHRSGRAIDANPAALEMFGYETLADLAAVDLFAAYESGDSRERARRRLDQLQGQPPGTALPVTDYKLRVGERRLSVRATGVMVDAEGGPAVLSIFVDDTERLAAEEMVRRSEALLSHLVATSPDLVTLIDVTSGRCAMVNHAFERITGWSAAEAVGRTWGELELWCSAEERAAFVARLAERGEVGELPTRLRAKDGHEVSLIVSGARFAIDRRDYIVINARDVTEHERARLEREAILDNASVGIAVTRARCFVLANPQFEAIFGWGAGELIGQPGRVAWASDEDYARVGTLYGPALTRGESVEFESRAVRRDGSTFLGRIRAHAVDPKRPAEGGTVWIVEDITERREAELALARARDEAEAANRAKSTFLANTSHELRTPLNGMIGLAQLAREPGLDEATRTRYLAQIADSAQSLAGIISDILDLSKIEAGKLVLETASFDLGELFETLRQTWTAQAEARGLELRFEIAPGVHGQARGDALRVRQIASNYLSNAIKFTEHGSVVLRATRPQGDARLRIEVQDSGPGIDPQALGRLFKPFTQADESTTRRFGGSGLGLSICRELAAMMGGEVGVDSREGVGSLFWAELQLPAGIAAPPPPAPAGERTLAGARVLLVEDNPVNMMIAAAMLVRWGVEVDEAADGIAAQEAVARAAAAGRPHDLVLMDVQMPVMSGHEATRALRAAGYDRPIVALTAAALVSEREAALEAGMNDFLTKPIDMDKLRAALLRWCAAGTALPEAVAERGDGAREDINHARMPSQALNG